MPCRNYRSSPIGHIIRFLERLYHLAEAENLASILEHGPMSTETLLGMLGISEPRRAALLRSRRPDSVRLSESDPCRSYGGLSLNPTSGRSLVSAENSSAFEADKRPKDAPLSQRIPLRARRPI
jgi:hypothetical protein